MPRFRPFLFVLVYAVSWIYLFGIQGTSAQSGDNSSMVTTATGVSNNVPSGTIGPSNPPSSTAPTKPNNNSPSSTVRPSSELVTQPNTGSDGKSPKPFAHPALLGGLAGAVVLLIIVIIAVIVVCRRRRKALRDSEDQPFSGDPTHHRDDVSIIEEYDSVRGTTVENVYDNLASTHLETKKITVNELYPYVVRLMEEPRGFYTEFKSIPNAPRSSMKVADKQNHVGTNRYRDVLPYDNHRVILKRSGKDDNKNDYINASYINSYSKKNAFIAAQAPMQHTLADFWLMIWQEDTYLIVMLANVVEDGRLRCEQYWPNLNQSDHHGEVTITNSQEQVTSNFTLRTFQVSKGEETKEVLQVHFTVWADKSVPRNTTSLVTLRQAVRSLSRNDRGPTIVHCSAGIGRTGTYIALDHQLDQAATEGYVDIKACVNGLRDQRALMVQNHGQYRFIYLVLLEALMVGPTHMPTHRLSAVYEDLVRIHPSSKRSKLDDQFAMLEVLKPQHAESETQMARYPGNDVKNRSMDVLPVWYRRIMLNMPTDQSMNSEAEYVNADVNATYINAVSVDGYKVHNALVGTQMPFASTAGDLWTLVLQVRAASVIMLNETDPNQDAASYWPEDGQSKDYGYVKVRHLSTAEPEHELVTIRQLKLLIGEEEQFTVEHISVNKALDKLDPSQLASCLLFICKKIEQHRNRVGDYPPVVHCMDGARHTGLYCAFSCIYDTINEEQDVDVYQAVKLIRDSRPEFIPSIEQYQFLYQAAMSYVNSLGSSMHPSVMKLKNRPRSLASSVDRNSIIYDSLEPPPVLSEFSRSGSMGSSSSSRDSGTPNGIGPEMVIRQPRPTSLEPPQLQNKDSRPTSLERTQNNKIASRPNSLEPLYTERIASRPGSTEPPVKNTTSSRPNSLDLEQVKVSSRPNSLEPPQLLRISAKQNGLGIPQIEKAGSKPNSLKREKRKKTSRPSSINSTK